MEKSGLNLKEIKSRNLSSILYLLNENDSLSRKDIADRLSLTPAAVSKLCSELIDGGLIKEVGESDEKSRAGRKKIMLSLRLNEFYALCINAEVDKITISVSRLDGTLIISEEVAVEESIEFIIEKALKIKELCGISEKCFVCTSICVIGRIDNNSFGLWDNEKIKRLAAEKIKLPVFIDNNIQAFALAELIYGKRQSNSNVLFLKWGPGIASAIARDGIILSGQNSDITEIGHYIIRKDGKKCRCGRYGCLETEVSSMEIVNELDGKYSLEEIISCDDLSVSSVIDSKIDLVALALTNTATILNPDKIILFGSLFKERRIFEKLSLQFKRYNGHYEKDTIALSKINDKISYIGAVALAAKNTIFEANLTVNK